MWAYRYEWDGSLLRPNWEQVVGTELYDHGGDDGMSFDGDFEAMNLAEEPVVGPLAATLAALVQRLEAEFGRSESERTLTFLYDNV